MEEFALVTAAVLAIVMAFVPLFLSLFALAATTKMPLLQKTVGGLELDVIQLNDRLQSLETVVMASSAAPATEAPAMEPEPVPDLPPSIEPHALFEDSPAVVPEPKPEPDPEVVPEPKVSPDPEIIPEPDSDPEHRPQYIPAEPPEPPAPEVALDDEPSLDRPEPAGPDVSPPDVPPPTPPSRIRVEELLGERLFLKAGVAIVVIGVAFFLAYTLNHLGPAGKVMMGFATAAGMFAAGMFAERKEDFRNFGRGLLAGAWAMFYFVTFSMHFIPAARVIDSPLLAMILLAAAAAFAVVFSLRYRNEWTTVFAFLLIHLTSAIAAWQGLATFNLVSTAVIAIAIATLYWKQHWEKLLAVGLVATWSTLAMWLVNQFILWSPPARQESLVSVIVALTATWLAFQLCLLLRRNAGNPTNVLEIPSFLANLAGGFGLLMYALHETYPEAKWMAAAAFGLLYVATAVMLHGSPRRVLYLLSATIGVASLALVPSLNLGAGNGWVPVWHLLMMQVVLAAGVYLRDRYVRGLGYVLLGCACIEVLAFTAGIAGPAHTEVPLRLVLLATTAAVALLNAVLLRTVWGSALDKHEVPAISQLYSAAGSLALFGLIALEVAPLWIGPTMAAVCLLWAALACRFKLGDLILEGLVFGSAAPIALLAFEVFHSHGADWQRPVTMALVLLSLYAAYALYNLKVVVLASSGKASDDGLLAAGLRGVAVLYSVFAACVLGSLVWLEVPEAWVAPALTALVALHIFLALRYRLHELLVEGVAFTAVGTVAIGLFSWELTGTLAGIPWRPISVGAALLSLFVAQQLLERKAKADSRIERYTHRALTFAYLTLPTVILGALIRAEVYEHEVRHLVALIWALVAVGYMEVARLGRSREWMRHGLMALTAATVHLFAVNVFLDTTSAGMSLRLWTMPPFLLALVYAYKAWDSTATRLALPDWARPLKATFLYVGIAVVATLLAFELGSSWVVTGWALLAVTLLVTWSVTANPHWRLLALIVGAGTVARGALVNLAPGHVPVDVALDQLAVGLACLTLLCGYVFIFLTEGPADDRQAPTEGPWMALAYDRLSWLVGFTALLTGFIVTQSEGTELTIFLSIEGLGLVAIGFLFKERLARLGGLTLLSACILKLFIYDMRGLTGLPRIFSFVTLGGVLIAVSYVYTQFRKRLAEYL